MDRDEVLILNAFNGFAEGLAVPDFAPAAAAHAPRRRPLRLAAALIAAAALLVITACAALGGFNWLLEIVNPRFGEVIEPAGESVTVDGVRLEALAAKRYGELSVVYVALTDTELAGRVTDESLYGSFRVSGSPLGLGNRALVYYDAETQTAVYEFVLIDRDENPADTVQVSLANLPVGEVVELPDALFELDPASVTTPAEEISEDGWPLLPQGKIEDVPDAEGWWLAAAGVEPGALTIVMRRPFDGSADVTVEGRDYERYYYSDGRGWSVKPYLLTADGVRIFDKDLGYMLVDENNEICSVFDSKNAVAAYYTLRFETDSLDGARLGCTRSYVEALRGPWELELPLESDDDTIKLSADVAGKNGGTVRDVELEITPLGTIVRCSYTDETGAPEFGVGQDFYLETAGGEVHFLSSATTSGAGEYIGFFLNASALELQDVQAVIINSTRIPITPPTPA